MSFKRGNFKLLGRFDHYVPSWKDLLNVVLFFIVGVLVGNIVSVIFLFALGAEVGTKVGTVVAYVAMFIPAFIYAGAKSSSRSFTHGGLKVDSCNFGKPGGLFCALMAMLAVISASFCTDAVTAAMPPMPEWLENALKSVTEGSFWLNLLCVGVFAAFFEEWLCRGIILRGMLGNKVKPALAIPLSALFFAVIHANPWQAVPAFILGCLFGYIYYRTGSLKLTMLMHFVNNTVALVLSNVESTKTADTWLDILPANIYWIVFAGCLMLLVLILLKFSRIPLKDSRGNFDAVTPIFQD